MQNCCYLDLIITIYKLHLPNSTRLQRVEHKSELRCFAFLISAVKSQLNKETEAAARARQQNHHHVGEQ